VLQPLTVAVPLLAVGRLRRAKIIFNVQDLHPDALVDIGLVKNRFAIAALRVLERLAYRCADALAVICDGFRDHCIARGADPAHVEVIPNWIDLDEIRPQLHSSRLRAEIGIPNDAIVVLYAGTIGLVSGADVLIDACALLPRESAIRVVFVGEGQLVSRLKEKAARLAPDTVFFLPFQPRERLNEVQSLADISVVTLLPGHARTSVPSKVLGYMAAGRPVIAAVDLDSETARLVHAAGAGWVVPPGDPNSLARALHELERDEDARHRCGQSGRRYLEDHHRQDAVLERYARLFREPAVE
jgi:colanic acid biosynthesis glycosyl transferase WcaI